MKCSQCSADLPDTTTFCPRCGTSTYTSRTSKFSYLPSGTPPWPTTVPQQLPNAVDAQSTSSTSPLTSKKSTTRPGRKASSVVGVIAVLVIAPLIAALITAATLYSNGQLTGLTAKPVNKSNPTAATPQATAKTNSLPVPTSFKTAKDANINISIQYPSDWSLGSPQQSTSATSLAINSQDQIGISFVINRLSNTVASSISGVDELNQSTVQSLQQIQGSHEIQTVQATNAKPTIAGEQWTQKDATLLDGQNTKIHFTTIADKHSKSYYVIYFLVPDSIYQEALQKYLNPMLNSVKFLS